MCGTLRYELKTDSNQQVRGSSPLAGSIFPRAISDVSSCAIEDVNEIKIWRGVTAKTTVTYTIGLDQGGVCKLRDDQGDELDPWQVLKRERQFIAKDLLSRILLPWPKQHSKPGCTKVI